METPVFLDVAGEEFTVQAEVLPESGPWTPPAVNETTAAWVYGAVINYVFGLDDTNENQELLSDQAIEHSPGPAQQQRQQNAFLVFCSNFLVRTGNNSIGNPEENNALVIADTKLPNSSLVRRSSFLFP